MGRYCQVTRAIFCNNLGIAYRDSRQWDLAEQEFFEALKLFAPMAAKYPKAHSGDVGCSYWNLGQLYLGIERRKEARDCFIKAREHYLIAAQYHLEYLGKADLADRKVALLSARNPAEPKYTVPEPDRDPQEV